MAITASEKSLAMAIYMYVNGQLSSANAMFDYLLSVGFFESEQNTNAFITVICSYFPTSKDIEQVGFQQRILKKLKEEPLRSKYRTTKEVHEYMKKIGFFFDDNDLKIYSVHALDQVLGNK